MSQENGQVDRKLWWWVGGAVAGAVVVVVVVVVLWVVPALYTSTKPQHGRAQAVALTRTGFLTTGAAFLALVGVMANLAETRRATSEFRRATDLTHTRERDATDLTHAREREAQLTERFTRTVEQLGSTKINVRIGGIYAMERLAKNSRDDQPAVVEVLSAFVRIHSTDLELRPAPPAASDDVHAAVTVLGRLPDLDGVQRADLTGADLTGPASLRRLRIPGGSLAQVDLNGADLTNADLSEANLSEAQLDRAILTNAHMKGANLTKARLLDKANLSGTVLDGANLTNARLGEANLTHAQLLGQANLSGAVLDGANLTGARLDGANLTGALLRQADLTDAHLDEAVLTYALLGGAILVRTVLEGANLTSARLDEAVLTDARLSGATLSGARLDGAKLSGAWLDGVVGLVQDQLDVAQGDARTVLPDGMARPASWPEEDAG